MGRAYGDIQSWNAQVLVPNGLFTPLPGDSVGLPQASERIAANAKENEEE